MSGVNKVILVGNLGRDPELKYTNSGTPVCKLNLATSTTWTDKQGDRQEDTEWTRVTVWGKQAEHCNNFLAKGRQVYVEGRLRTSSYGEGDDKRWSTEVVAQHVQFLGGKGEAKPKQQEGQRRPQRAPEPYDPRDYGPKPGYDDNRF